MANLKTNHFWFLFGLVLLFFIFTHISGVHSPYHQDEYKWVLYSHPEIIAPGTVPHPPLTEFIYTKVGPIIGDFNFRFIPFFFGILNFFLIFYLARIIFNPFDKLRAGKIALWTVFLFSISFYSLLASLTVDVDGAVMPFFFLLLAIGYFKWKESDWVGKKWIMLSVVGAVGGVMIKMSGILPIVALALDFAIENKIFADKKKVLKYGLYGLLGATALVAILYLSKFVFPFFNLEYAFGYWKHFATSSGFLDRGWFQTFIQFFKAILYTSPLLVLPAFFAGREIFQKTRPFYLFLVVGLIFYLFVFDFSIGALDRYFQFMVIPLAIISGAVFSKIFEGMEKIKKSHIISLIILIILLISVQFIPHVAPSLHPKSEWLSRAISLKWNFLYPFTGGSGPLGFYVSFLFISLSWILSIVAVATWRFNRQVVCLVFVFCFGVLYNIVFTEEYLFGRVNGSASKVLSGAVEFIRNNPDVKSVTVYNDNGGFDIQSTGKYHKRLYTDPKFGTKEKIANLNLYKEHYLEVNIPRIDPNSFYRRYLDSCEIVYEDVDRSIYARVYDCRLAPDVKTE